MKKSILAFTLMLSSLAVNALHAQEEVGIGRDQGLWQMIIMIGVAMLFFYVIIGRPEQKRRKELDAKREAMRKGDKVTAMGILGTVHQVKEHTVILKMVDGSKIEFLKAAINDVETDMTEKETVPVETAEVEAEPAQ